MNHASYKYEQSMNATMILTIFIFLNTRLHEQLLDELIKILNRKAVIRPLTNINDMPGDGIV